MKIIGCDLQRRNKQWPTIEAENRMAAVALNYFAYNFHQDPQYAARVARMAAGVTTRVFNVADLIALLVESESKKAA